VLHAVIEAAGSHDAVRATWHATMRRYVKAEIGERLGYSQMHISRLLRPRCCG
jgi:hypothetical protein